MTLLDRNAILCADDLKTEDVPVPEWGGVVRVRALTGTQREVLSQSLVGPDGKPAYVGYRAKLLSLTIVGEDGAQLFTNDDVQILGERNAQAIERVFAVAERLSGMGSDAVEEAQGN